MGVKGSIGGMGWVGGDWRKGGKSGGRVGGGWMNGMWFREKIEYKQLI